MNKTKKRLTNTESKLVIASGEERRGNIRVGAGEVQTAGRKKIGYKDGLCNAENKANILE